MNVWHAGAIIFLISSCFNYAAGNFLMLVFNIFVAGIYFKLAQHQRSQANKAIEPTDRHH